MNLRDSERQRKPAEEALHLATVHGCKVIPVHGVADDGTCTCGTSSCTSAGKHPATAHGYRSATKDPAEINRLFARNPDYNIGIATGRASGRFAVDVDPRNGGDLALLDELPQTQTVETGGAGLHLHYLFPEEEELFEVLLNVFRGMEGVDVLGDGKIAIMPSSRHASGQLYRWMEGRSLKDAPPADITDWLRIAAEAFSVEGLLDQVGPLSPGTDVSGMQEWLARLRAIARDVRPEDGVLFRIEAANRLAEVKSVTKEDAKQLVAFLKQRRYTVSVVGDDDIEEEEDKEQRPPSAEELLHDGCAVLDAPDQLEMVRLAARKLGYAGDTAGVETVYVAFGSRSLARPINPAVEGPSAAGKSFTVDIARRFFPPEAVFELTAASERYLAYSDFETRNAFVWISEAAALHHDGVGATIIRELAWGNRIRYGFVEKTEDGLRARIITRPGPTGLITTSTRPLDREIATRMLRLQITDSAQQVRAVVDELARQAVEGKAEGIDFSAFHAAHRWLAHHGNKEVVVPYAQDVSAMVPVDDVRMNRDITQILSFIMTHAMVHQRNRDTDDEDRIIANEQDYRAAYRLLDATGVLSVTLNAVSEAVRETVEKVQELVQGRAFGDKAKEAIGDLKYRGGISVSQLAQELGLSVPATSRRVKQATKGGYLVNGEDKKGYPAKLLTGEPLPVVRPILPTPEEVFGIGGQDRG